MTMTLSNGDKIMLVEVPEDAIYFEFGLGVLSYLTQSEEQTIEEHKNLYPKVDLEKTTLLGTYHKGEIDFEVNEEWTYKRKFYPDNETGKMLYGYKDWSWGLGQPYTVGTAKESFLSLLQSLTEPGKKYVILNIKK